MIGPEYSDEQEIIRRCAAGDRDSYAVLVDRYRSLAYTVAFRMVGDRDTANDLAQEGFIAAYTNIRSFRFGSKFSTWLCSIVLNKCRDHLRAARKDLSLDEVPCLPAAAGLDPERCAARHENRTLLQEALMQLPSEYREVLILKHIEGREYGEIAEILGVTPGALKVRAHRGREMLKSILERTGALP